MIDHRQGNDLAVLWSILKDGEPFDLRGRSLKLYLKNLHERKEVEDFSVTGNEIHWTFYGKDQDTLGKHSLILVANEDEKGMITTDACDFVRLVSCSCKLQGGEDAPNVETENIELTSTLEYVSGGGEYDDTALWKELENKVDKVEGKGLSSNDFTDEEREKLAGLENYNDAKLKEELSKTYQPKENIYYFEWDSKVGGGSGELDEATYQAIMAADKVCLKDGKTITEPTIKVKNDADCVYGYVADKRYVLFVSESNYAIIPTSYYDDKEIKENITELSAEVSGLSERVDALGEGGSEVFEAKFKETSYDEIKEAFEANKVVYCYWETRIYMLTKLEAGAAYFAVTHGNYYYRLVCYPGTPSTSWGTTSENFQHTLKSLANGKVELTIAGKTAEVATPQYVANLLGTIINGDY